MRLNGQVHILQKREELLRKNTQNAKEEKYRKTTARKTNNTSGINESKNIS